MRNLLAILTLVPTIFAGEEPKKPEPPDRKAFSEALNVSDPKTKIDALRKFIGAYPKSTSASRANDLILETLAKSFPHRSREVRDQVDLILKTVPKGNSAAKRQEIAETLVENGVLLKRAEELARTALRQLKEKEFTENEKKSYQKIKLQVPDKEALQQHFRNQRARFLTTLGKIYLKCGDSEEGGRLMKEAYTANPMLSPAAAELGILAGKAGNYDAAFDYLIEARLTGVLKPVYQRGLEDQYRKKHGG